MNTVKLNTLNLPTFQGVLGTLKVTTAACQHMPATSRTVTDVLPGNEKTQLM
jgi:hypothetical protein